MTPELLDLIGIVTGAVLTLLILSYVLGDNPLYRFALHLFIGALVGYSLGVALRLLLTNLFDPLLQREYIIVVPVILAVFLLLKGLRRYAYLGNLSVAYLVGVGAAVALSGALFGTLLPQVEATGRAFAASPRLWARPLIVLVGSATTLMAFTFLGRQARSGVGSLWARVVAVGAWIGRWFLVIALGVTFAGAVTAALSVLIGRVQHLIDATLRLLGG
jgi:hypothetical protein